MLKEDSYVESTGWNQPGEASSSQYVVEGSVMLVVLFLRLCYGLRGGVSRDSASTDGVDVS
jgi:hypothetical protein